MNKTLLDARRTPHLTDAKVMPPRRRQARQAGTLAFGMLWILASCQPTASALPTALHALGAQDQPFERPHPRLDWPKEQGPPMFVGVELLGGSVRMARPSNWMLRDGDNAPGSAYVHYVSPRGYSFALYQRSASQDARWADILRRYQERCAAEGIDLLGRPSVFATARGDGRLFSFRRLTPHNGETLAVASRYREMLIRGQSRLVLVQVIHQGHELSGARAEVLRALSSLEVH